MEYILNVCSCYLGPGERYQGTNVPLAKRFITSSPRCRKDGSTFENRKGGFIFGAANSSFSFGGHNSEIALSEIMNLYCFFTAHSNQHFPNRFEIQFRFILETKNSARKRTRSFPDSRIEVE